MDNKKILLVEDDALLQKLYTDLLKEDNYSVEVATDGLVAYQKMKDGGWDLVLLDILLPELNGIKIVKKLKTDKEAKPNKKIVFLTNLDKGIEINEIQKLGLEYIIKSSLNPDEFLKKVKSFLQ